MNRREVIEKVQAELFEMQDLTYRDFHAKLMPTIDKETIIGVRTPMLRTYAKKFGKTADAVTFLEVLPHKYYEENNLHGLLIEQIKDYPACIAAIERFLPYVNNWATGLITPQPPKVRTGKRVAVVGSGPSGLAAAMQLNRRGHSVTVFERRDRVGGLLRYGIPNMKLDKSVIDRRVDLMKAEGIEFVTNADIGKDVKADKLLKEFDRVLLCCGAANPRDIKAEGRDAKGIYFAVDFLTSVTKSLLDSNFEDHAYIDAKGKHVVVIGGGDTGNDCVGTSIRLGAKSVTQLEMMPKAPDQRAENNPWPEWPKICKTDYGQEEAIAVFGHDPRIYQTTVTEFIKNKKGEVCQIKTVKLTPKKDEKSGRMMMVPVEGTEEILPADLVLIAAGFLGSQKYVTDAFKVEVNQRTNVKTDDGKYQTTKENVFTAGDMHRGQSLVVWAIREGREAAKAVDESLMGYTNL